jgi:hypothetical protein
VTLALEDLVIDSNFNIPTRVKLPNLLKLCVKDFISPPVLKFACASSTLQSIFLNVCDSESLLKILEAVGHNLRYIHVGFSDDDPTVGLDLIEIFSMCPIVEDLTLINILSLRLSTVVLTWKKVFHS